MEFLFDYVNINEVGVFFLMLVMNVIDEMDDKVIFYCEVIENFFKVVDNMLQWMKSYVDCLIVNMFFDFVEQGLIVDVCC